MLDVGITSFSGVDCLVGILRSFMIPCGFVLVFKVSLFDAGDFFSDIDVSFLSADFFLGLSLLASKEFSPNDL